VVCWKRKCPSSASEGGNRLSKRNETKFDFIAKEEEECGLLCIFNVGAGGWMYLELKLVLHKCKI